jgi:hypothetical protein
VKQLASGMHALLQSNEPEVRRGAQRLLKKVDPKLSFAEIEMEEVVTAAIKPLKEENETLRNQISEKEFAATVRAEHAKITSRGFKVDDVQKFMKDRGIVNYDTAMNVLDMEQRLAAPTPDSVSGVYDLPEESKDIFKNPAQWARKMAHDTINQLKARQRT